MANMKKDLKEFKLSKENAAAEFTRICNEFGFNVSTETKERVITVDLNNTKYTMTQETIEADAFIMKIMEGKIEYNAEKGEIVYKLERPIKTGQDGSVETKQFNFGQFTIAKQKGSGVPLNECSFQTLSDEKQKDLLKALTGISDVAIFDHLTVPQFNDLRMVGGYFFN